MPRVLGWMLLLACCAAAQAAVQVPTPVSPGGVDEIAGVEARCPTFSWAPVPGAAGQELFVVEVTEGEAVSDKNTPVATVELPGAATSWTPSIDRCLVPGRSYAWSIRALGDEGPSAWSAPRLFRVLARTELPPRAPTRIEWFGDHLQPELARERSFETAEAGPAGLTASTGIFIDGLSVPAGQELFSVTINCPASALCGTGVFCGNGKVVLGGGANLLPTSGGLVLYASYPDDLNSPPQTWRVWVLNTTGTPSSFDAHAICTVLEGAP